MHTIIQYWKATPIDNSNHTVLLYFIILTHSHSSFVSGIKRTREPQQSFNESFGNSNCILNICTALPDIVCSVGRSLQEQAIDWGALIWAEEARQGKEISWKDKEIFKINFLLIQIFWTNYSSLQQSITYVIFDNIWQHFPWYMLNTI